MTTAEIKKFLKTEFKLKTVRVNSTLTKHPYLRANICPEGDARTQLTYTEEFPLAFRQLALKVIYGDQCDFSKDGNAGNVNSHGISMHETEWQSLITRWNAGEMRMTTGMYLI